MVEQHYKYRLPDKQTQRLGLQEIGDVLDALQETELLERLWEYRPVGRRGYPLRALWRAYVSSFLLNLPSTNGLIRMLHRNEDFRTLCGFKDLPHRTTFNRFIQRLSHHTELIQKAFCRVTTEIATLLPDLGREIAVDATTVQSYSNPHRKPISDPEAGWTAKNIASSKTGKEWRWGYKLHLAADVKYGLPLGHITTSASRNDSPLLPPLMDKLQADYPWMRPQMVVADRGYDAKTNHEYLAERNILPVIHIRKNAQGSTLRGHLHREGRADLCRPGPDALHPERPNPRVSVSLRGVSPEELSERRHPVLRH